MGCASGKTIEGNKIENNGYPLCRKTVPLSIDVDSLTVYNEDKIILGGKNELQQYDFIKNQIFPISKEHKGRINCLIKLSNGKIVSAGQDNSIIVWDVDKNKSLCSLTGHKSMIWCISEVKKNKLISGADDRTLKLWDLNSNKFEDDLYKGNNEVSAAIQLKTGKILLSSGAHLMLYNLESKNEEKSLEIASGIWCLKELKDGTVAAGLGNGDVIIVDISGEITIKTKFKKGHKNAVCSIIELDNGKIVTAADENNLLIWDPKDVDAMYAIEGHTDNITGLAFISGTKFASVSKDKTLKIWE